jgi:hypothetical protein
MTSVRCPYCYQSHAFDGAAAQFKCTACGNFFDADAPDTAAGDGTPIVVPPIHAPPCLITRLTEPHRCHQCHGAIAEPVGLQRSTRLCPLCHKKTSIYARIYFCPECRDLLESPAASEGKRCRCPICNRFLTVPREVAFQAGAADIDPDWFTFPCPSCDKMLHSPRDCARELTFCPVCRQVFQVPDYGFAEPQRILRPLEGRQTVVYRPMRRCPRCQMAIPRQARECPYCSRIR